MSAIKLTRAQSNVLAGIYGGDVSARYYWPSVVRQLRALRLVCDDGRTDLSLTVPGAKLAKLAEVVWEPSE